MFLAIIKDIENGGFKLGKLSKTIQEAADKLPGENWIKRETSETIYEQYNEHGLIIKIATIREMEFETNRLEWDSDDIRGRLT